MDFFRIVKREIEKGPHKGKFEISPDFIVKRSKDLMVRARSFYGIWDEQAGLWSTDEYDVRRIVDEALDAYQQANESEVATVRHMRNFSTNSWKNWRAFLANVSDSSKQLDSQLTFADTPVKKTDYVSRRLPYSLIPGDISAWDELVGTLYIPSERAKIEWAIGAIVSGDSREIDKFLVFYGKPGAGKGTILKIVKDLFEGYTVTFEAKALGSNGGAFVMEVFRHNPLVAIQFDGDLSRIEDNTRLNSIISHEPMTMNEKYKPSYDISVDAFLLMGTNKAVKITDAQSGLIRRLIDVHPSGNRVERHRYQILKELISFELGAIAHHCLQVYKKMGKRYYDDYRPVSMMFQTDTFFNFVDHHHDEFKLDNGVSLQRAWDMYKEYCSESDIRQSLQRHQMRAELMNYFEDLHEKYEVDGKIVRNYYHGFKSEIHNRIISEVDSLEEEFTPPELVLDQTESPLDKLLADCPAQYSKEDGTPRISWSKVKTKLSDLDTTKEHYVNGFPETHIIIDFDLRGADGSKDLGRNLAEASKWPATYAELSKSGAGVHLHYNYTGGDPLSLATDIGPSIEVKVYRGASALRRRLTRCNGLAVAELNGGLKQKEKKPVLDIKHIRSEQSLRHQIARNIRKEIHPGTKPSIDFIKKILDDHFESGAQYDVTDLRPRIIAFANNSTNNADYCLGTVLKMRWASEEKQPTVQSLAEMDPEDISDRIAAKFDPNDEKETIYDIEVFPNLFVIGHKYVGAPDESAIALINPTRAQVEELLKRKLIGFNVRKYDNHILWAAYLGFTNEELYRLSKKIIDDKTGKAGKFGEAFGLSWTDIYDYASVKQSLKKWQVQLGLPHKELNQQELPWDKPVDPSRWAEVAEYCLNDVNSTEKVHLARKGDYTARLILADLSGYTANDPTAKHAAGIIFGRNPQGKRFFYTDLSKMFPGYSYEFGKSTYRDELVGEGGYVYAEPGIYKKVALLDVASMHPTSIGELNLFGDQYTPNFMALVEAQLAIKRGEYDRAKTMLDGKLKPYLEEIEKQEPAKAKEAAGNLRYALKIAINIVYGLTSAKFDNPFYSKMNKDNIVAKRGALFMIDLKHALQERGCTVAHIKTDSVKIPNATPEDIEFVMEFGKKYGYTFEHEATYSKMALFNDAVYVAKKDECIGSKWVMVDENGTETSYDEYVEGAKEQKHNSWSAVGAQFQHPYVFKTMFGFADDLVFNDLCETKSVVQGAMFLDFHNLDSPDSSQGQIEDAVADIKAATKAKDSAALQVAEAHYRQVLEEGLHFIGKTGKFVPVNPGYGGGTLYRVKDGKHYAVAGTKGYLWAEADVAAKLGIDAVNYEYFENLVNEARDDVQKLINAMPREEAYKSVDDFTA